MAASDDELTRLALEARDGDEIALTGLIRRTQADVWRFVAHLVDPRSADDLTQEVYLRAVPALARYRGDAPVRLWLLAIARKTCADELRTRVRRRRRIGDVASLDELDELGGAAGGGGGGGGGGGRTAAVADEVGHVDLMALVDGLDVDRRSAFVLTQLLGLPYDEAARVCGVPVGTIRSRVARARADLLAAATSDRAIDGRGDPI